MKKGECRVCGMFMRSPVANGWICPECLKEYRRHYDRLWRKKVALGKMDTKKTEHLWKRSPEDDELEEKARYYNTVVCPDIVLAKAIAEGLLLFNYHRDLSRNHGCRMNKTMM